MSPGKEFLVKNLAQLAAEMSESIDREAEKAKRIEELEAEIVELKKPKPE